VEFLVFDDGGWDKNLGPTHKRLNKIYRSRLSDPKLNPTHKKQLDVLSSSRTRFVDLELLTSEEDDQMDFAINVEYEACNLELTLVSLKI
jgi:hypothetical protein